ncbi:GlxA family transcriptional regulator [Cognatishimia sp. SS12]|uniref:GlxA family transcriptional regulator n=1 Tax=Cognatishimia sp. SS12 TaxID=2979465 RepID=UPI00232AEFA6|nr:GlxA family transcriptional regulator [Cognatishimia sp. SS12]MDC0739537.1 GlxA family transcriptional regulator [Cognatishimia sp. SS12]
MPNDATQKPKLFEFIAIDDFSMLSVIAAIEPLRVANRLLGTKIYDWIITSERGETVSASNGVAIATPAKVSPNIVPEYTFVCAGLTLHCRDPHWLSALLNRRFKAGSRVGAISMGSIFLARAGLLRGKRCTIHWEGLPAFSEEFPDLNIGVTLYEIDGDILTCAGGFASFDLFLEIIQRDHSEDLVRLISNQLQFGRKRQFGDLQIEGSDRNLETAPPRMMAAIKWVEQNIERQFSTDELADQVGSSRRTLERLFLRHTGQTPSKYIKVRRLERARDYLLHSNMSILDVAIATGFRSGSYFSACFSDFYGSSPSRLRHTLNAPDSARGVFGEKPV